MADIWEYGGGGILKGVENFLDRQMKLESSIQEQMQMNKQRDYENKVKEELQLSAERRQRENQARMTEIEQKNRMDILREEARLRPKTTEIAITGEGKQIYRGQPGENITIVPQGASQYGTETTQTQEIPQETGNYINERGEVVPKVYNVFGGTQTPVGQYNPLRALPWWAYYGSAPEQLQKETAMVPYKTISTTKSLMNQAQAAPGKKSTKSKYPKIEE